MPKYIIFFFHLLKKRPNNSLLVTSLSTLKVGNDDGVPIRGRLNVGSLLDIFAIEFKFLAVSLLLA